MRQYTQLAIGVVAGVGLAGVMVSRKHLYRHGADHQSHSRL